MCVPESQVLCEGMDSTSGVLCLDVVHLQAVVLCLESVGFFVWLVLFPPSNDHQPFHLQLYIVGCSSQ